MKTDFTLDSIFDTNTTQERFYKEIISENITDTINGYNGTVFTYGQSGSGKTFTMFGADIGNSETRGIIPRAV
jgi:kinesin family protein 5